VRQFPAPQRRCGVHLHDHAAAGAVDRIPIGR
jgi:hypothetical protein